MGGELEPRRGHCASPACHREPTQSCEGQRFHDVTNRVHLTCTPGSVGAPGSNPWSDPARNSPARDHNLSAPDAAYLELAMRRGLPLATLDDKLKAAAKAVGVSLYGLHSA